MALSRLLEARSRPVENQEAGRRVGGVRSKLSEGGPLEACLGAK